MGLLATILGERQSLENPAVPLTGDNLFGGVQTNAGTRINEETALTISPVWRAVSAIASELATKPIHIFRRIPDGKERFDEHPVGRILRERPNPAMAPALFRETIQQHVLLWGNGFAEIERDAGNRPVRLWPITPDRVSVFKFDEPQGTARVEKFYVVTGLDGSMTALGLDDVLHIPGLSWNGLVGRSVVSFARESLGLTKAAEEFGQYYFGQGSKASGVLTAPQGLKLNDGTIRQLREQWAEVYEGVRNAHRTVILPGGMTWQQVSIPPNDAQFLETRRFQVDEVARWFGVPPHKLYQLERATFSNIEHSEQQFDNDTILPWAVKWEQALNMRLFPESQRGRVFVEFLMDGVLRADTATRGQFYQTMINLGVLSINEVRALENRNPVDGGDVHFVSAGGRPVLIEDIGQTPMLEVGPPPPAPSDDDDDDERGEIKEAQYQILPAASGRNQARRNDAKPMFESVASTVVTIEGRAVRRILNQTMAERRAPELLAALNEFYDTFGPTVAERFLQSFRFYGATAGRDAMEMVNQGQLPSDFDDFIDGYSDTYGRQWVAISAGKLRKLIRDTEASELEAAMRAQLDQWEQERPAQVAREQSVDLEGAVRRTVFAASGTTVMRWRADADPCPLCQALDGRTVSVEGMFQRKGDTLDPDDGATTPLKTRHNIASPPLHGGCQCEIVPG